MRALRETKVEKKREIWNVVVVRSLRDGEFDDGYFFWVSLFCLFFHSLWFFETSPKKESKKGRETREREREVSFLSLSFSKKKKKKKKNVCWCSLSLILEKRKRKKKKKIIERLLRARTQTTLKVRLFLVQGLASSLFKEKEGNPFTLKEWAQRVVCAFRDDERVRGRTRSGKERVHRGRRGRERGGVGRKSARASEDDYAGASGKKGKKILFDFGRDFQSETRQEERKQSLTTTTQKGGRGEDEKRRKERRTHGVQRDRRDAKRRAMADVAKRRGYSPTENLDSTHVSARRASPRARLRGRWIFVFFFFVVSMI